MKCIAVNGCEDEEQKFCQCGPVGPSTSTGFPLYQEYGRTLHNTDTTRCGVAAVETIGPVYLAEISGAKIRGALCGYYTVFWNFGIMCAFMVSDYLPFDLYTGALIAVPTLFCITFFFMPESPYYYFIRNQSVNGKKSLKWLRHGEDIEVECKEIEEAVREDMKNDGSWKDLIATKKDRRALLIVLINLPS
uniref:Major facilitator superfamily (MFS) profile domain-containing protein n=1 Tax=Rhodnius prolixus TaxID=13249 RepID=T1I7U3_RHOPR